MSTSNDIRGVMIGVTGGRLLLPNATVAEVITFALPEQVPDAPNWLIGRIRWRGWRVPLISYARMAGLAETEGDLGAKVVVLKALGGNQRHSYFAILTQGFPRLVTVSDNLLETDEEAALPEGALMSVTLRDEHAFIPDLNRIESLIVQVLEQAA